MIRVPLLLVAVIGVLASVTTPMVAAGETGPSPPSGTGRVIVLLVPSAHPGNDAAAVARAAGDDPDKARDNLYWSLGAVPIHVAAGRQAAVENHPNVRAVLRPGVTVEATLAESVPHIGASGRHSVGYTGAHRTVAVIDTGTHRDFGGTIIGQACYVSIDASCGPSGLTESAFDLLCFDVGVCTTTDDTYDPSAGRPCPASNELCQHGTAVSAVTARSQSNTPGVARGATVYPIRVFEESGSSADLIDVYESIAHVIEMHEAGAVNLAAVNLSLATAQTFTSICDTSPDLGSLATAYVDAFAALRVRGIAPVVSTGNGGKASAIGFPSCLSNAIPVGASDLNDVLADFSNRLPGHTILAPGADSALPSAGMDPMDIPVPPGYTSQWAGTSFAAPHVAGAMTVLDHEYPLSTVQQKLGVLHRAGRSVSEYDASTSYRRIGMDAPWTTLPAGTFVPGGLARGGPHSGVGDFDSDGRADVFLHRPGTDIDTVAYGRGDVWAGAPTSVDIDGDHRVLVGNFLGSRSSPDDVLLYSPGSASDYFWAGRGDRTFDVSMTRVYGTYQTHIGDFDDDGWDDLFWYAPGPASDHIWYGGSTEMSSHQVSVHGDYRVAVGDFNGDGGDDVVFHGPGTAPDHLWTATSSRDRFTSSRLWISGSYHLVTLDWNGDKPADMLLYAAGSANDYMWLGNTPIPTGGTRQGFGQKRLSVHGSYWPVVGDVNDDGLDDIAWYTPSSSTDHVWLSRAGSNHVSRAASMPPSRHPRIGDVDGLDGDDLVFVDPVGTASRVWWSHVGP